MRRQRSSILVEIAWLAYFFAIFVIFVYLLEILVVPHHFNDKIAIVVAAMFAGLAMIGSRAFWTSRTRR